MLRRHKVLVHDSGKETNQSIILGFESDVQRHCTILESKGKSLENFKCEECDYKLNSSGKLLLFYICILHLTIEKYIIIKTVVLTEKFWMVRIKMSYILHNKYRLLWKIKLCTLNSW